jgi:hypothetical protein
MKVIAFTFAGREDRMPLLEKHVQKALDRNLIDEWHVWDFCRDINDKEWLNKYFLNKEKIQIKKRPIADKPKYWSYAYTFYSNDEYSDCIFIKIDDDVLFFDVEELPNFINFTKNLNEKDFVSANVINNPPCFDFQKNNKYFKDGELVFNQKELYDSYVNSKELHKYFLKNYDFIKSKAKNSSKIEVLTESIRISINFIGFKHGFLKYFVDLFEKTKSHDDEEIISTFHREVNKANCYIYESFLASHIAFNSQEKDTPKESKLDVVDLYNKFTEKLVF